MQTIKTTDDIKQLGTIMCVFAHPDDETFTMGGILAAAAKNGQKIICITATRGEKGVEDESRWPASRLAAIRTDELTTALKFLGVEQLHWLDYPDGGCNQVNHDRAVQSVVELIRVYRPDSIFTFGSDGLTGHPDHCTVSAWAREAAEIAGNKAQVYNSVQTEAQYQAMLEVNKHYRVFLDTNKPVVLAEEACTVCFELDDDCFSKKLAALEAHTSQYDALFNKLRDSLRAPFGVEAFVRAD